MSSNARGYDYTGASAEAASEIEAAVRAFTLGHGNPGAHLKAAEDLSPGCPMAALLGHWFRLLSNVPAQIETARAQLAVTTGDGWGMREKGHLEALRLAASSKWRSAVSVLDRLLMDDPHDLAAHQCAMRFDSFLGRFHRSAARSARALPFWSREAPNYGILLSMFGFGLEELGDYGRAEDVLREAAELEPYGYWPHHGVTHVLEMTGRAKEGVDWMDRRSEFWTSDLFNNRLHIWWHKALFHLDLGETDEALRLYDREIAPAGKPAGLQLCNLAALLWRLELLGIDAGDRWAEQHVLWQQQTGGGICNQFNEIHAVIAALRTGDTAEFERLLSGMRQAAEKSAETAPAYREVAVPIAEALADFVNGDYTGALDRLLPLRASLSLMGGSAAQRDLIEWTMTEAAIRAKQRGVAVSLANERLAFKPEGAVNRRFLAQATSIPA